MSPIGLLIPGGNLRGNQAVTSFRKALKPPRSTRGLRRLAFMIGDTQQTRGSWKTRMYPITKSSTTWDTRSIHGQSAFTITSATSPCAQRLMRFRAATWRMFPRRDLLSPQFFNSTVCSVSDSLTRNNRPSHGYSGIRSLCN